MQPHLTAIHRVSSGLFYVLGTLTILCVMLLSRDVMPTFVLTFVNTLDLPLIGVSMLYGGSSFLLSLHEPPQSIMVLVWGFLASIFVIFAYLNFAYPFQVIL